MKRFKKTACIIMILLLTFTSMQFPCIGNETNTGVSTGGSSQGSTPSAISTGGSSQGSTSSAISVGGSGQGSTSSAISVGGSSQGSTSSAILAGTSGQGSTSSAISAGGSGQGSTSSAISAEGSGQGSTSSAISATNGGLMQAAGLPTDSAINYKLSSELATGGAINTVTVYIYDSNANPIKDRTVYFGTNFGVISQNSVVTNETGNASVTVTSSVSGAAVVSMSFPDESGWKSDKIEIKFSPAEDPDLKADYGWLTADTVFGTSYVADKSGTEISYIVSSNAKKLNMSVQGPNGSSISWTSSNTGLVAPDGTVTAPPDGQEMGALITAVLSRGEAKTAKMFYVSVTHFNLSTEDEKAIYSDSCWLDQYIGNLGIVSGNISLPAVGANGCTISWTSGNPAVIAPDGTVTRPGYSQYYADGQKYTLTATLSKGTAEKIAKPCTIQVKPLDKTEEDTAVCSDYDWLSEAVLTLGGDQFNLSCVTWNLYLPGTGSSGSTISWASSNPAVVTTGGAVKRPTLAEGNKIVTLTAAISKGNTVVQKIFQATVLPVVTSAERVALDKEWLTAAVILNGNSINDVKTNITLPKLGQMLVNDFNSKSTISWETSDANTVSTEGKVTRPGITENDRTVTLTATITFGDITDKKSFDIVVTKKEKLPVALKFEDFTNSEEKLQFNGLSGTVDTTDASGKNIKALQFVNGTSTSGGSIFTKNKLHLNKDMSFSAAFAFKSRHANYILGKSGFTFALQAGGNKAYSQNEIKPSLSISVDRSFQSYQGSGQATGYDYEDYIEVFYNGNNDASAENGRRIKAGSGNTNTLDNAGFIWIDYDGQSKTLKIRYGYTPDRPGHTALELTDVDLGQILMSGGGTAGIDAVQDVYPGFIGSSGTAKDNIEIFEWYLKNGSVPIDPQIYFLMDASNLTLSADPAGGAASSTVTASVNGTDGPVAGLPIEFSSTFGSLDSSSKVTDASGKASAILSTNTSGSAVVMAIAGGVTSTVAVSLIVTAADIIMLDRNWLTNERILNGNSGLNNIVDNLSLPVLGFNGSNISWTSSKEDVVSTDGKVARPTYAQGEQAVTLTAAISKYSDSTGVTEKTEKIFYVTVKAQDSGIVAADREWLTDERVLNGNSALDYITKDLYLPALGINGSNISWTFSKADVVSADGRITRPTYAQGDQTVALTATISKYSESAGKLEKTERIFNVTVKMQDTGIVAADRDWLTNERVLNGNSALDNITKDLCLPALGVNGSSISWTSSIAAAVATDGKITRLSYTQGDQAVTLTATIRKGSSQVEKSFEITVKKLAPTAQEAVSLDTEWLTGERVLNGNSALDNITKDLYLPALGFTGSNISWISSKPDVVSADGKVTRPSYAQGDQTVTLTATLSQYSPSTGKTEKTEKIFNVTVKVLDSDIAAADRDWLTNERILNGNSALDNITKDLCLPVLGANGSSISWTTSPAAIVATDGKVTRLSYTKGDQAVKLTAAIRKGSAQVEKSFDITVMRLAPTDKEAVSLDFEWLTETMILNGNSAWYNVTKDLKLPAVGPNGTTIDWTSSNDAVAATDGTVKQPSCAQGDQSVKLTAAISRGFEKTEKEFSIKVKSKATDQEAVSFDYKWLDIDMILNGNSSWTNVTKDLKLPVAGPNETVISWISANEDRISTDGKVSRLPWSGGDMTFTLTAVISKGAASLQKKFFMTVKRLDQTDPEAVAEDTKLLRVSDTLGMNLSQYSISRNLSLPSSAYYGSSITWTSDMPEVISDKGIVTRPEYGEIYRQVTLTAVLTKGTVKASETFVYTVLPKPDTYAPQVMDTTPKDNGADIVWNTREITITFDENIKRGSLTGTAGANSLGIQFQDSETQQISARVDNNKLIITSYSDLTAGENVLIIPAGAVTDMSGNPAEAFKLSFSVEQKQNNKIEVIASNPEDMAKQVAAGTKISFSYNNSNISKGSAFSGISIRTKAGSVISAEPVLSGAEVTLNLHAALQPGTVYEITIPAGAVQDRFENFSSEKTILFRTALSAQESEIISAYPLDGQKGVDIHEKIEIGFSDVIKAKDCKLVLRDQKGNLIQTIVRSLNTSQSGVILEPCVPLTPNTEYTVEGPYLSPANPSKLDFSTSFTTGANALQKVKVTPAATNDVPINLPIAIEFGDAVIKGSEFSKIKISDSKGSAVAFSANEKDKTAVLSPSSKLAEAGTYTVSIPKGAYKDANGGVNDAFKFEFTTAKQLEPDSFTVNPSTTWLLNKPLKFSTTGIANLFKQSGYQAASYEWSFGDGQNCEESNPIHTYSIPGNYQVTLTLKDDKGFSYEFNQTVTIESMDLNNLKMSVSSEGRDHIYIKSDDSSLKKLYKIQLTYNGGFIPGETIRVKLYKNGAFQKDLGTVTAGIGDNEYLFPFYYGGQGYLGTYELVFACEGLLKGKVIRKPVIVDEGFCMGSVRVKLYDYNTGYLEEPKWIFNIDGVKREAVREWYNEEDGYCYIIRNVQLSTSHTIDPWLFTVDMRYYRDGPVFLPYTEEGLLIYKGTKIGPGVNKVTFDFTDKGEFSFIEGVDTGVVSFIVDGNWDATRAGYYEMKTDSGRLNIKSTKPEFKLNAGTELRAGEELYVRMVSYYGSASSWQHVNVQVLPKPSLDFGPKLSITFADGEYHISMPMGISTIIGEGIPLLDKIPLLGDSFGFNNNNTILDGKMEDGWIYLDFGGGFGYKSITEKEKKQGKKVKITSVGYEIDADMQGELGLQYDYDAKLWKLCYGEFELLGFVDKQWGKKYCLPKVNIGIGATLDIGTFIGGDLIIDKSDNSKRDYSGIIKIEPVVKATLLAGVKGCNISFSVTGSIPAEIHIPTGYIGADVTISANVGATCLLWSEDHLVDVELLHEHWDNGKAKVKAKAEVKAKAAYSALKAEAVQSPAVEAGTGNTGLKPMSRDYLTRQSQVPSPVKSAVSGNISMKSEASRIMSMKSAVSSGDATAAAANPGIKTIKENIFPEAGVQLVHNGNELWTVWTDDNPERSSMNRTQMRYSILKDGTQSEPVWMGQDGTADFAPAAAAAEGGVLMAWQNIKQQMKDDVDIATFAKNAEINVTEGVYKAGGSEPKLVTLTDDDKYDHSPELAAAGNRALLVWTKSEGLGLNMGDNLEEMQSPANSDGLFFSSWNGNAWSTPAGIEGSLPTVMNSSLTMHGDEGLLLYTLDMDNNLATDEDREVFARTYINNMWGEAVRITDNQASDSEPKAVWCNGKWFITWYRDGSIMYKIGLTGEARTEEFLSKAEGTYGIALKQGVKPQVAVIYGSAGEDSARNLSAAFYDVECGVWSDQIPLTKEEGFVKSFSAVFTEDQKLNIAYTQAEVITEVIDGAEQKSISDKVDLHMLAYTPAHDLALTEEDGLQLSADYPLPGTVETVSTTIRNQGDFAEKATLCLYDGNPKEGGTKIGEASTAQPIPARSSAGIQVEWVVDQAEKDSYNIYAVVQPDGGSAEIDTGNNTITRKITTADVAVTDLECDNTDGDQYLLKVKVANKGSKSLDNVKIQLDQGGAAIETKELGGLWPGEEEEFSLIFSSANLSKDAGGKIKLILRVMPPEGIVENSTENNKAEFVLEPASIVVDGADPIQGEKQAGAEKPLTLRFSMPVEAGAGFDQIVLNDEDLNKIAITKKLDGSTLTVTPKSTLAYGTQYILTIPVNALGDSYGHALKSAYSLSFTTAESCPEVVFAYPGCGTDDIAPGEQIRMQYSQGILAGPAFKNITLVGPDSKKISAAASLQGKWLTVRPSGSLDKNTQYSITIPKGAIENSNGELQREDYKLEFTTANTDKPVPPDNPVPSDNPGGESSGKEGNPETSHTSKDAGQPEYKLLRQTAKDGVSTAAVELDGQAISKLKTEGSTVMFDVSGEVKKDGMIRVSLSGSAIKQLLAKKLGFNAITGKGNVCLPADLIKSLVGAGDNAVAITVAENKKKLDNNGRVSTGTFDFSITVGGKPAVELKPRVIVTIPLDMSKVGNAKRVIACVYSEAARTWQPVGGTADPKSGTLTFGTGHFSTYAAFETVRKFDDVKAGWAKEKVEILASRRLIKGTAEKTYSPEGSITRAEFTALITRSLYMDLSKKSQSAFEDVAKDSWYADAVETAYALGLVSGTGANRFEPDSKISREQLAVIAYRLYQYKNGKKAGSSFTNTFTDRKELSSYAKEAVNFVAGTGIMKGSGDKFEPRRSTTRQEAAVVLYRLLEYMGEL